jgi:hypothetical protein
MPEIAHDIDILSITKPIAQKEYDCAWGNDHPHKIPKGRKYVRCVWEGDDGEVNSDHICIECWTKPV